MRRLLPILSFLLLLSEFTCAQWGVAPAGWGNFAIGLTDESSAINPLPPSRYNNIKIARTAGANFTGLTHRVRYINNGVNPATNWYSWLPGGAIADNYITDTEALGMRPAFNIYMLQEDGGAPVAVANMADINFMRNFFWNVVTIAQKANGHKAIFVIEPDTWGYLIKATYGAGPTSAGGNPAYRPNAIASHVNDLGAGYAYLAGLPNTCAGVAQGIIRTIRTYAPDAYIGFHTNHWAAWSNGATGAPFLGLFSGAIYQGQAGMPFWNTTDIDVNINFQLAWYNELFGGASTCDKGDFLVVEKYGQDEGARWQTHPSANVIYYGATQYQKWLYWCKKMDQGLNLPLLGWQLPLGVSTLTNGLTINAACVGTWNYQYKEGFNEYFFANTQSFICAGFIGIFMGPGVGQAVTYYNSGSPCGDQGYFFSQIRSNLDPVQPLNMNLPSIGACAASSAPTCTPLPLTWLSFYGQRAHSMDRLTWITSNEINTDYFEIEESLDGENYTTAGRLEATGNASKVQTYHFEQAASAATVYYRIRQVDYDGRFSYTRVVVIGATEAQEFSIFPNPASNQFFVSSGNSGPFTVEVLDLHGRSVGLMSAENVATINTEGLSRGIYLVRVTQVGAGVLKVYKVVLD